ncbi:MAG: heme ABC transporter permease [Pseudomonadota bacterium]|nr:heme ABC transporter permease [Pseudomonadota bacterium]MDE3037585.1 heme ABC transporter permease [Pseudomonadota bacterium]
MHSLASPAKFIRIADRVFPWLAGATVILLIFGLAEALFISPPDYQQGDSVRIMYVHVPSAWMSMMIYTVMAGASASFLIWRHPLADIIARRSALIGAAFTLVTLITGSLWGKPMWGAWWVWDARLTSVLILFFMYIGYIALSDAFAHQERGKKACAILALAGFLNIPVIHFSVQWWNTLHQPASILREGGIAIAAPMLVPLFSMGLGFTCFYALLLLLRVKTALIEQKIRRAQMSGQ